MPRLLTRISIAIVLCALPVTTRSAGAQALGTFRWQTQPDCNVVTLTVVAQGAGFMLTGSDDLCGGGAVAPAAGTAAINPNGSIALGVSVVTPTGATAQISATLNAATVSGTWADAAVAATGAVVLHGPGFNVPNPLVVEHTMTNLGETIVTPKAGRLSITKYVGGYALCSTGTAHVLFLTVDGVPIRQRGLQPLEFDLRGRIGGGPRSVSSRPEVTS